MSELTEHEMLLQDEKLLIQQIAEVQELLHTLQYDLCILKDALRKYEHLTVIHLKNNQK
jgi:hypothetical protein